MAVENRALEGLSGDTPAGCKLVLTHPHIRQGMLLLTPACCRILGGCVTRLEKARQAVRERWNEPPGSAVLQAARARSTNGVLLPPPGGPLAAGGQVAPPSRRDMALAAAWAFETAPPANGGNGGPASNGHQPAAGALASAAAQAAAAPVNHVAGMSEADLFGDDEQLGHDPAVLAVVTNGVAPAPQAVSFAAAPAPAAVSPLPMHTVHQPGRAPQQTHRGGLVEGLFPPPGVEPDLNFPVEEAVLPAVPAAKPAFVRASSMVGKRRSTDRDHSGPSLNDGGAQPPVGQRGVSASGSAPPSQASLSVSAHGDGWPQDQGAAVAHATPASPEAALTGPPFTYLAALLARGGQVSRVGLRSPVSHGSGGDGGAAHGFLVGTILGFVGTLTCFKHEGQDEYDMRVVVEDGSAAVEARVDGGLLARRLGVTPARDLKAAMDRDPGVKQAVLKLTRTLQRGFGPIRIQLPQRAAIHSPAHPDAAMPVVLALPDDEAHQDWSAASDSGVRNHVRLVGQQLLARLKAAPAGRDAAMGF